MPKGDKKFKTKKRKGQNTFDENSKELVLKTEQEEYALVTKLMGDCKVMVQLPDSTTVMARIPGKWRKKIIVKIGNIVLISKREYQASMVDIITQYTPVEVRELQKMGEIPATFTGEDNEDRESGIVMLEEIKGNNKDKDHEESDASLSDL
jgi:translation initiation factor 1A